MKDIFSIILIVISVNLGGQDISEKINVYTSSYANTGDFSGCVQISKEGKTIFENCYGLANHSFNIKNEPKTKFKIGSISKQFTAAAILILEQNGLLHTSDQLSLFYPEDTIVANITLEQLMNHTSGVPDIYTIPEFNKLSGQKKSIADIAKMLCTLNLDFLPGDSYQYSNGGYALLADIIEKVSGEPYQSFLKQNIFIPLNMNDSGHNLGNEVVPNLAVGYDPLGYDQVKITDYLDPELLKGSGSLYSTLNDLNLWIESIKDKSFLKKTSYEKLLKNYGNSYGLGISVYKSKSESVFGHDGRLNGYISDYLHYLDSDITIIILGNIQTGVADFFRSDIASIIFKKPFKSSAKVIPPNTEEIEIKELLGTYSFGPGFNVYVEEVEGLLQARANEGGYSELILLKDDRFFSRTLYSYISFIKDDLGNVLKMIWTNNNGNQFEGIKQ